MTKKRRYEEADNAFYLKYKSLEDMLKIIIYSSQSMLGTVPMLYHIIHNDRQILFIQTAGGVVSGNSVNSLYYSKWQTKQEIHWTQAAIRRI